MNNISTISQNGVFVRVDMFIINPLYPKHIIALILIHFALSEQPNEDNKDKSMCHFTGRIQIKVLASLPFCFLYISSFISKQLNIWKAYSVWNCICHSNKNFNVICEICQFYLLSCNFLFSLIISRLVLDFNKNVYRMRGFSFFNFCPWRLEIKERKMMAMWKNIGLNPTFALGRTAEMYVPFSVCVSCFSRNQYFYPKNIVSWLCYTR